MSRWLSPVFLLFVVVSPSWSSPATDQDQPKESFFERIQHPDRNRKSEYAQKKFDTKEAFTTKTFKTGKYSGTKEFESKSFATKVFESAGRSWFGKILFPPKKLPERFQGADREADKSFASKSLASREYAGSGKKNGFASQDAFPTKTFIQKGKTQGAIDNNPKLQDAVKRGLSIDDVRNLLNKPTAF